MNLVSIIIPMYNEVLNIDNCVNILKNQKNQDFDVFFIDDGSKDGTIEKLQEILTVGVFFNYQIIKQSNQGAAAARKEGIKYSSTEFIMILDCDDKISSDTVEEIYKKHSESPSVDIIIPDLSIQSKNGDWQDFTFYTLQEQLQPLHCIQNSFDGWYIHGFFAIRRLIINQSYRDYELYNRNNKNYLNNDEVITRLNFKNSKEIIRSSAVYYYCYNFLSTTKRVNPNKYLMINNALILNEIFLNDEEIEPSSKAELVAVLWGVYLYMYRYKKELGNISEWENVLRRAIKDIKYFHLVNKLSFKKKLQLTILKLTI